MSGEFYRHTVNGRHYDSRYLEMNGTPIQVESLKQYKQIVRQAYGDLRGVKFETVSDDCTYECGHCGRLFTHAAYQIHMGR